MRAGLDQGTRRRPVRSVLLMLVACALVAGGLWPSQLGGRTTWLVTHGTSMEPGISRGDLVVVRGTARYSVGDVVAYRSPDLDQVVLHRIVKERSGRFVFQGDNNDFLDPGMIERRQIIGAAWVHLQPATYIAVILGLALVAVGIVLLRRRGVAVFRRLDHEFVTTAATGVATLAIVGVIAVGRTEAAPIADNAGPTIEGSLSYEGRATRGATYPDGKVDGSDPLYLQLVPTVEFAYEFTPPNNAEIHSEEVTFDAVVSDENGFERRVSLSGMQVDAGRSHAARGTLDLKALAQLVTDVQRETQVTAQDYAVTLEPRFQGRADDTSFSHEPAFSFRLHGELLQPPTKLTFEESMSGAPEAPGESRVSAFGLAAEAAVVRRILQLVIGLCALAGGLAWALGRVPRQPEHLRNDRSAEEPAA